VIKDILSKEMIAAMKAKNTERLSVIRLMISKIKEYEINNRPSGKEMTEADELQVLQKMIKQGTDAAVEYRKGNREDLASKEEAEVKVIKEFMPKQLGAQELEAVIQEVIAQVNPQGAKDIGKVVAVIKEKYAGQVDMALTSVMIKDKIK
jgi:uncharacterized protein YqeY